MFNLFKRKEKFLLLDVSTEKISGLLISLDSQKRIKKEKFWENIERHSSRRWPSIPIFNKTIVACNPELAVKIFIPLSISRESGAGVLERVELENLLAQAIGKVFNHYRREASLVLGEDELDTILADSNVSCFEVDGHKVINPLGFSPNEIKALMEMTFSARRTYERIKTALNKPNFFLTEKGQAQSEAIKRLGYKKADFLSLGCDKSYFYPGYVPGTPYSRRELKWSTNGFISDIGNRWNLGEKAAEDVYYYYLKKGVSPVMDRYLSKILSKNARDLGDRVKKIKTAPSVCFTGDVPVELIGRSLFYEPPLENFLSKSGFSAESDVLHSGPEAFQTLAPFLEFYYDNSDNEINGWLKRRLHWLGSAV